MRDLADALGYRTVPMPKLAIEAAAEIVAHLPFLPEEASWVEALRRPVLMDAEQGAAPTALAPAPRRARDAAPDGQRAISVTGTPKRRCASPSTSSSR